MRGKHLEVDLPLDLVLFGVVPEPRSSRSTLGNELTNESEVPAVDHKLGFNALNTVDQLLEVLVAHEVHPISG